MFIPTESTEESEKLCAEIAKKSKGVCFLGYSGGKDSLAAWLYLQKFFQRIIVFHCAPWPKMKSVSDYLDYVEYEMGGVHILRMIGEDYPMALYRMMYQPFEDCEDIATWELDDYSKLDVLEFLRYKFALPRAWCAFGISASDSIDRAIYVKKTGGKNPQNRTFYPTGTWTRKQIVDTVRDSGIKLPSSYRYLNRTMGNVPGIVTNEVLKAHYPEDWGRMLDLYPLAEAKTVREQILDREWEASRRASIESTGGSAASNLPPDDSTDESLYDGDWMEDDGE